MELTIYDRIIRPIASDKAYRLNRRNQLMLEVHPQATKPMIKEALEKLFNIKVEEVRTSTRKFVRAGRMTRKYIGKPSIARMKIAYITLAEGYSLNLFDQTTPETATGN
jgi:large subunit ribosomal protein L23